ncbi:MAG: glycosyl hydrolase family 28 protein [Eubacteriales bacterium]|nr:glycosyl hydrolase family 28 protein [Eubacteriales bacterium]
MQYSIVDYGAKPGQLCTEAIQKAIDAAETDRGTVVIPAGVYITGTLNLRSVSLYLQKGAILQGSGSITDYPEIGYCHTEMGPVRSLLYSLRHSGITISGEGRLDLNGSAFYDLEHPLIPQARVPLTAKQIGECTLTYENRPNQPIFFLQCDHLTIRDVEICNAPSWTLSFCECSDVRITDVSITNSMQIPNCDGMHFCCCDDISVRGCHISAGDDCIALTALTNWDRPCERVTISDCVLRSASKAISIGYMHSVVRDVTVSNCIVTESNRALVMMANPGTGLVENVTLSNLRLDARSYAGAWWGNGEPICLMATPHDNTKYFKMPPPHRFQEGIRHICGSNLVCSGENALAIVGDGGSIRDVQLKNFSYQKRNGENLKLKGRMIDLAPGEQNAWFPDDERDYWLYLRGAKAVRLSDYSLEGIDGKALAAYCEDCEDYLLRP